MDKYRGLWINPWIICGFSPQNSSYFPPPSPTFPPFLPNSTVDFPFSTTRCWWKSLFIHCFLPPPAAIVSHKAHRFLLPEKAVENRKFCIIPGISLNLPPIGGTTDNALWISRPNSPVYSRFSQVNLRLSSGFSGRFSFLIPSCFIHSAQHIAVFPRQSMCNTETIHTFPPFPRLYCDCGYELT